MKVYALLQLKFKILTVIIKMLFLNCISSDFTAVLVKICMYHILLKMLKEIPDH